MGSVIAGAVGVACVVLGVALVALMFSVGHPGSNGTAIGITLVAIGVAGCIGSRNLQGVGRWNQ